MSDEFVLDFVGIGAERSATSWISDCLREHPEIAFSKEKEIYFFNDLDRHYLQITNLRYFRGLKWYQTQFPKKNAGQITGEFSPTYLYCPLAAKRLKKNFPNAKIVVCLRDPVERAYSQYLHDLKMGALWRIGFEEALAKYDNIRKKGRYLPYLRNYYRLFLRENILTLLYDDVVKSPAGSIRKLYKFLGLADINFTPAVIGKKSNEAALAKYPFINFFMLQTEYFFRRARLDIILKLLEGLNIRQFGFNISHYVNIKPLAKYPQMDIRTEKKLRSYYKEDILKLSEFIGRDLSPWLRNSDGTIV